MSSEVPNPKSNLPPPRSETPAQQVTTLGKKKPLYLRVTSSMPLLITVIVHVVLIGLAGAIVAQQNVSGKKKTFEATAETTDVALKQVEHRLQVARRSSASSSTSSPVSAQRIYSTATNALTMPEMPELPSVGSGVFGGFGGTGSGISTGSGTGMATSLGNGSGLGGRGFMSLSFLGSTSQNVSKVVFVVDTSTDIMDLRKGGFEAFKIIREEIMRLVSRLPHTAQFNVVLFRSVGNENGVEINLFRRELTGATTENKKEFFEWMQPVNAKFNSYGPGSAGSRTEWKSRNLPSESGIDPLFLPPVWARAAHAALEMQPDTVFVITSSQGAVRRRVDDETIARRRVENNKAQEAFNKEVEKEGLDPNTIRSARDRAYAKAGAEFDAANRKLVAAGKNPIVITNRDRMFQGDVQAELRKSGITIELDTTGWTKKDGTQFRIPSTAVGSVENLEWDDFIFYFARLQRALLRDRAAMNVFLFVGPNDKPDGPSKNLTAFAKRNGGTFQLLTTKRLEELKAREDEAAKK